MNIDKIEFNSEEVEKMEMKIKLGENQPMPEYQTVGAAAFDLVATTSYLFDREKTFLPMDMEIAVEVPKGYYAELVPRSSLGKKGLFLYNTVGIIDSDYRGNIIAMLGSTKPLSIAKGERILQVLIKPVIQVGFNVVDELDDTDRGAGGFGHTGK